jgi:protein disulfide-isomerase A6
MLRSVTLLAAAAGASAGAVDLTPSNFDTLITKSGKSAFVKFLAPW